MGKVTSYKDLLVWQKSMGLVETVYRATKKLPVAEQWGLTQQLRRAAVSIPSNIAEGYGRQTTGAYRQHLLISRGSLLELETQIILCQRLGYTTTEEADPILGEVQQLSKMLSALISKIH